MREIFNMRIRIIFTLVFLTIFVVAPSIIWGATFHVAKTGNDSTGAGTSISPWLTIQKALNLVGNAISSGDTIQVHSGMYTEAVTTTVTGGSSYVTLMVAPGDMVTVNRFSVKHSYYKFHGFNVTGTGDHAFAISTAVSYIEIRNCNIDSQGSVCGINFADQNIDHITIDGCIFGPSTTALLPSIRIRGNNHIIKNCKFNYYNGLDSIYLISNFTVIQDNTFNSVSHWAGTGNHPDCIQADGESFGNAHDILVQRNIFKNISGQVIRVYLGAVPGNNVYNWTIRNNVFANIGAKTIQAAGDSFHIHNNTFYLATNNTSHPVGFRDDNTNSSIINSKFIGCGNTPTNQDYGWWSYSNPVTPPIGFAHDYNYVASTMASNWAAKRSGVNPAFNDTQGINGGNPRFVNVNKDWVWVNNNGDSYNGSSSSFEVLSTQVSKFVQNEYVEYCPYTSGCDGIARKITGVSGNIVNFSPAISGYIPPDCFTTNSCNILILLWGFNNNVSLDFSLQANSPSIDKGRPISSFSDDLIATSRSQGTAWDIGAYEYNYGLPKPPVGLRIGPK
jgi:hypothetical protein